MTDVSQISQTHRPAGGATTAAPAGQGRKREVGGNAAYSAPV